MPGKFWLIVFSFVGMAVLYYFLQPLFWLVLIMVFIYFGYRWYERRNIPSGRHINHGLLKGYLTERYGDMEGGKLYQRLVRELQRKGYR